MSSDKKDFYGKEVPDAIKKACETLDLPQERLDIEVLETGSTGIFGLIRKKAHIRVSPKPEVDEGRVVLETDTRIAAASQKVKPAKKKKTPTQQKRQPTVPQNVPQEKNVERQGVVKAEKAVSPESLDFVKAEILRIVELMGCPSTVEIEATGISVTCTLRGDFEDFLTGPDGKTLDSMQYLLRKIVARNVTEQLRLNLNVGDYREKRLEELKIKAGELAVMVKEDGKTQVLPALNPSERRTIHMTLQEDKEIRSRSVGDGLFKKILIYKPGKGGRSGSRKGSNSRGRQNKSAKSGNKSKKEN